MAAGFLITLREGLEAFLVVGIIISYLSRCGLKQYTKWVYVGVGLGVISAFFVGLLFQVYYSGFESKMGEHYLKIVIMGIAVVILTYMVIWMTKNGRNLKNDIENNLKRAVTGGSILPLVLMGYLAILREGFETVLFLGALYGDNMNSYTYYGGVLGLALALVVTLSIFKGMKKVPLSKFFMVTGYMIMFIAAGLLINMVGVMQDVKILPVIKTAIFDISFIMNDSSNIGIFFKALFGYTHSPSLIQVSSYIVYFTTTYLFLNSGNKGFTKMEAVRG